MAWFFYCSLSLFFQSIGTSLTFRGTVYEASELLRNHKCKDPICDTNLWKVRHELDMAKIKMKNLEAELIAKGLNLEDLQTLSSLKAKAAEVHKESFHG